MTFFESWNGLLRVALSSILSYGFLLVCLRFGGKRVLSKLNAFDLVITVALGSATASVILSKDVALAEGMLALACLVLLQVAVAWTTTRSARIRRMVKSEPRLLALRGKLLKDALSEERVSEEDIREVLRQEGVSSLEEVHAIVLETNGQFSVLQSPSSFAPRDLAS